METIANAGKLPDQRHAFVMHAGRPDASVGTRQQPRFRIRAASTPRDLREASRLVDKMYATRGYCTNSALEIETTPRKTFIAMEGDAQVGTLSIGFGCAHRLLAEDLFPDEIAAFRKAGHGICEFTKLAVDRRVRSRHLLPSVFHIAYLYARKVRELDFLLIEVNPRHVRYYEMMLGFKVAGGERHNSRVNAPAVLLSLDLAYAESQIKRLGGNPGKALTERSAYPYFFSPQQEADIATRLQGSSNIADVHDVELSDAVPVAVDAVAAQSMFLSPLAVADPVISAASAAPIVTHDGIQRHAEIVAAIDGGRCPAHRNLRAGAERTSDLAAGL